MFPLQRAGLAFGLLFLLMFTGQFTTLTVENVLIEPAGKMTETCVRK